MDEGDVQAFIDKLEAALQMWIREEWKSGMTKEALDALAGFEVRSTGTFGPPVEAMRCQSK